MGIIKEKSINSLMSGLKNFEDKKDNVKNADFKNIESFIRQYLNTEDKKQRLKLAEEFKKRHLELFEFLQNNSKLITAETQMNKIISAVISGNTTSADDKNVSNLLEMIEKGLNNDLQ